MVASDPRLDSRRRAKERTIWIIDLVVYGILAGNGVVMLWFTSQYVEAAVKWPAAIALLGVLLLVGGTAGFIGRVSMLWMAEMPGLIAALFGSALYSIVLGSGVSTGTSLVPVGFVVIAFLKCFHRYMELRILTSEPAVETFTARLSQLLRRRTKHTVPRRYY